MRLNSFVVEGADNKSAYTGGTYAGNASSAIDTCIKGIGLKDTRTKDAGIENAYTRDTSAIEHSKIHS